MFTEHKHGFNTPPKKTQHQLHPHVLPKYGQKQQLDEPKDRTPRLGKRQTKFLQEVTGAFLFYAQAVLSTILTALNAIASEQAAPAKNTLKKIE